MAEYRRLPLVVQASQWFKNGDHPEDYARDRAGFERGQPVTYEAAYVKAQGWEGAVVRYYRHVTSHAYCSRCGGATALHGWIDTQEGGHVVCPGDWVITEASGERYPLKDRVFRETHEPVRCSSIGRCPHVARGENFMLVRLSAPGCVDVAMEVCERCGHAARVVLGDLPRAEGETAP